MRTPEYEVQTSQRAIHVHSTNRLLGTDVDVVGGKTGFISKAGYCLATLLQVPQGPQVAVVVLGAANSTARFWEARHLFNWVVGRSQGLVGGDEAEVQPAPAAAHQKAGLRRPFVFRRTGRSLTLVARDVSGATAGFEAARPRLNVLMVASEVAPWAKTGGLADVVGSLPEALDELGHDVTVVMPRYRGVADRRRRPRIGAGCRLGRAAHDVDVARQALVGSATGACSWTTRRSTIATVSTAVGGRDFDDNAERFALLAVGRARRRGRPPTSSLVHVIHAHDWQAGLASSWLRHDPAPLARPRSRPGWFRRFTTSRIRGSSDGKSCRVSACRGRCSRWNAASSGGSSAFSRPALPPPT